MSSQSISLFTIWEVSVPPYANFLERTYACESTDIVFIFYTNGNYSLFSVPAFFTYYISWQLFHFNTWNSASLISHKWLHPYSVTLMRYNLMSPWGLNISVVSSTYYYKQFYSEQSLWFMWGQVYLQDSSQKCNSRGKGYVLLCI